MMLEPILFAAAGGAAGALVGWFLTEKVFRTKGRAASAIQVVCVVLAIAAGRAVAESRRPSPGAEMAAALNKEPLVQTLRQYYPDSAKQIEANLTQNLGGDASDVVVGNAVRPQIAALMIRQMPSANTENTTAMVSLIRDEATALLSYSPEMCVQLANGGQLRVNPMNTPLANYKDREAAVTQAVLEQTATRPSAPVEPVSEATVTQLSKAALARIVPQYRAQVLDALDHQDSLTTPDREAGYCRFMIALFEQILAMPPEEGARAFKGMTAAAAAES